MPDASNRRRRFRRAGEPLVEDSSARDALVDEEAQQLLDWALAHVEAEVERTLTLVDEEAEPHLDDYTGRVRAVMHHVNRLMEELPQADEAAAWEMLLKLGQSLRRLDPAASTTSESTREIFDLARKRQSLGRDELFQEIMDTLPRDEPDEATPPDDTT